MHVPSTKFVVTLTVPCPVYVLKVSLHYVPHSRLHLGQQKCMTHGSLLLQQLLRQWPPRLPVNVRMLLSAVTLNLPLVVLKLMQLSLMCSLSLLRRGQKC
jgi:hypothetical protein